MSVVSISGFGFKALPPPGAQVDARFFRGLSDPTRLLILESILDQGEMNVTGMVAALNLPRSRIATHLACLRACGYVTARREGRYLFYTVTDPRVQELLALARAISSDHGDALSCCRIIQDFTTEVLLLPHEMKHSASRRGAPPTARYHVEQEASLVFGAWLHERMQDRGLTARSLAQALGISIAAVHRWVYRGGLPAPALRPRLAEALQVSVDEVRRRTQRLSEHDLSAFAEWLDRQLQQRDWTRSELARRLGLEGHSVVSWFQRGSQPRQATLEKVASLFSVAPENIPTQPTP